MRTTLQSAICSDLGYCCQWFFFTHYRNTQVISDRLGLATRTIREGKAAVDSGTSVCANAANCLHRRVTLEGNLRQRPLASSPLREESPTAPPQAQPDAAPPQAEDAASPQSPGQQPRTADGPRSGDAGPLHELP